MTEVLWDGKPLKKLELFTAGEDGQFLWLRGTFKDGIKKDSLYLRGTT